MSAGIDFPWLRRIRVSFGNLDGSADRIFNSDGTQEKLRIAARVEKAIGLPHTTNLMLWNLSENTRNSFRREKTTVRIEAGWDDGPFAGLVQCFKGKLLTSSSQRAGADIVTSITAMSAIDDLNLTSIGKTWPPGYPVAEIAKELARMLPGVTVDDSGVKYIDNVISRESGWSFDGTVREALSMLSKEFGFSWSITDQHFQACKDLKSIGGETVIRDPYLIDVNPVFTGSGMIRHITAMRIRSAFNASLNPMFNVKVESTIDKRFNAGTYIMHTVAHNLDCWTANSFTSEANCIMDTANIAKINDL